MFKVLSKERSINRIKRNKQLKPKRIHSTLDPGPHKLCLTQKKTKLKSQHQPHQTKYFKPKQVTQRSTQDTTTHRSSFFLLTEPNFWKNDKFNRVRPEATNATGDTRPYRLHRFLNASSSSEQFNLVIYQNESFPENSPIQTEPKKKKTKRHEQQKNAIRQPTQL